MDELTADERAQERRRRGLLPGLVLIALIIVLLVLLMNFLSQSGQQTSIKRSSSIFVPDVVGMDQRDATATLMRAGFKVDLAEKSGGATQTAGTVLEQRPAGGATLARGSVVAITVANGAAQGISVEIPLRDDPQSVPDVIGHPRGAAVSALSAEGYDVDVFEVDSESVAAGLVITQNPSGGTNLATGETVSITVSTGRNAVRMVRVPEVLGLSPQRAADVITAAGLKPYRMYGQMGVGGAVKSQWPTPGTLIASGSEVFFQGGY